MRYFNADQKKCDYNINNVSRVIKEVIAFFAYVFRFFVLLDCLKEVAELKVGEKK